MKKMLTYYDGFCEEMSAFAVVISIAVIVLAVALVKWGVTLAAILKFFSL